MEDTVKNKALDETKFRKIKKTVNFWDSIYDFFHAIGIKINSVIVGLSNLIRWSKLIYKDRQYDYEYLYLILNHKLKLMEEFFNSSKTHVADAPLTYHQIRETREILERIINNNYSAEEMSSYEKKYGALELTFVPLENGNYQAKWNHDSPEQQSEYFDCIRRADQNRDNDRKQFFEHMSKSIVNWWD